MRRASCSVDQASSKQQVRMHANTLDLVTLLQRGVPTDLNSKSCACQPADRIRLPHRVSSPTLPMAHAAPRPISALPWRSRTAFYI